MKTLTQQERQIVAGGDTCMPYKGLKSYETCTDGGGNGTISIKVQGDPDWGYNGIVQILCQGVSIGRFKNGESGSCMEGEMMRAFCITSDYWCKVEVTYR